MNARLMKERATTEKKAHFARECQAEPRKLQEMNDTGKPEVELDKSLSIKTEVKRLRGRNLLEN